MGRKFDAHLLIKTNRIGPEVIWKGTVVTNSRRGMVMSESFTVKKNVAKYMKYFKVTHQTKKKWAGGADILIRKCADHFEWEKGKKEKTKQKQLQIFYKIK